MPRTKIIRAACRASALGGVLSALLWMAAARADELGDSKINREALIGIFYDFKQDQQRRPNPDIGAYRATGNYTNSREAELYYAQIEKFIYGGYDEGMLNRYFRASRALYTTQIFIPNRPASSGPKAFGVEKFVEPTLWLAHYKGQVIPPVPGVYEFVASADGFIAIAVNGENVLVKHLQDNDRYLKQLGGSRAGKAANGTLRHSLPFKSDGKTPLDLDILLAEAGGVFNAFVLYRRKGETYARNADGQEILPVFQLAPREIPKAAAGQMPAHARPVEYWKAVP